MRRRDFLAGAALAATCRSALSQQSNRVYRIGYLGINQPTTPLVAKVWKAFDEGLRSHGLIEGENVIIHRLFSEGREERQPSFVAELLEWKADVIVCGSMAGVRAASEATTTIPIILAGIGDPERLGTVKSLARPGVNITGLLSYILDVARQYQLLKEILPSLTHVVDRAQKMYFYYEVYEPESAAGGTSSIKTSLSFYRGAVKVFETPLVERAGLDAADRRAAIFQFEVPASGFQPGLYTCQVNIIDDVAGRFVFPRLAVYVR